MFDLLIKGKRIINVDESFIDQSNYTRRSWSHKKYRGSVKSTNMKESLKIFAALDTDGNVQFALSHANTNQDTFMLFMRHLVQHLDQSSPGWQESSLILLDNAPYHNSKKIKRQFKRMQIPIMYSAAYSYTTAPIESFFSLLKTNELFHWSIDTGKT